MPTKLWIFVFAGSPADEDAKSPHTSLYVEHAGDGENKGTNFEVTGNHPVFRLERRDDYDPSTAANLRKKVLVGDMPRVASRSEIGVLFAESSMKNSFEDADWNCRNWVGDVLQRMVDRQWLMRDQRESALDTMIEICLDIEDED